MAATLLFLAVVGAITAWWLARQRLTAKPWLEEGVLGEFPGSGASTLPAAKIGLGVFLAVVGSLFALFVSAYSMRMHMGDWRSVPVPRLLWFNTAALVASSVALYIAQVAARSDRIDGVKAGLLAGGASALVFLAGQLLAWQELAAGGHFLANPAVAFFYLLTAMHGLHLVGGLAVLGRTTVRAWHGCEMERLSLSVELCAMYWHFLLLVWLVLFSLLSLT